MMVLSGAMFPFDKLNRKIGNVDKVPLIAEMMPTRWTYEALMVSQFKDNKYSKVVYDENEINNVAHSVNLFELRSGVYFIKVFILQKKISEADFNKVYRIPELRKALETSLFEYRNNPKNIGNQEELMINKQNRTFSKLELLTNELASFSRIYGIYPFKYSQYLTPYEFNPGIADSVSAYLNKMDEMFSKLSNSASDRRDRFYNANDKILNQLRNDYYNFKLEEIVTKYYERKKILLYKNTLVQNTDPIYLDPARNGILGFRTHFYAPAKYFFGIKTDTFSFNIALVLLSTIFLYLALYYELLAKVVQFIEKFRFRKRLFKTMII